MTADYRSVQAFADDLRRLFGDSSIASLRALAREIHYSHEIVSSATRGKKLPSLEVLTAFVAACGGDVAEWQARWREASQAANPTIQRRAQAAWPTRDPVDGADPEEAGCDIDATTVSARRVSLIDVRHVIGEIELRYSARGRAAWGRFKGFEGLDKIAAYRHAVSLDIDIIRLIDGVRCTYSTEYGFDVSWGDILLTVGGQYSARVEVFFDTARVAAAETPAVVLPLA